MPFNSILNRYILKEMIPPFIMNMAFFMFVFLMRQVLDITNMIVNYQIGFMSFIQMLIYSMPYFFVYIIPMSVMMAVLLTFLRLSNDNEITALKSSGIGIYRLVPPVLLFGLIAALITAVMTIWGQPRGELAYKQLAFDVVKSNFNLGLKERQFNDSFEGVMFYVNQIDVKNRSLLDVFINDHRQEGISTTVVAPKGFLFHGVDPYNFILRLYDGTINQVDLDKKSVHSIRFDTYDIQLDLKSVISDMQSKRRKETEMSLSELITYIRHENANDAHYYSTLMEFHKKMSIPFACIAMALLSIPLGIQTQTTKRTAGLGIGLFAFLFYYLLLSVGYALGESGKCSPVLGMWLPNIIMGGVGVYLLVKTANDQPVGLFVFSRRLSNAFFQRFGFRTRQSDL